MAGNTTPTVDATTNSERRAVVDWAREQVRRARVSPTTKLVVHAVLHYGPTDTRPAYPSVKTLMADTGLSNRVVCEHVKRAVAAGLLRVEQGAPQNGRFAQNMYYVPPPPVTLRHPATGDAGSPVAVSPVTMTAVSPVTQGHANSAPTGHSELARARDAERRAPALLNDAAPHVPENRFRLHADTDRVQFGWWTHALRCRGLSALADAAERAGRLDVPCRNPDSPDARDARPTVPGTAPCPPT